MDSDTQSVTSSSEAGSPREHNQTHKDEINFIIREIQAIYDSGTPLFTKDVLRKLGAKLDEIRKGLPTERTIVLTGINGVDAEVSFSDKHLPPKVLSNPTFSWCVNLSGIPFLLTSYEHAVYF